MLWFCLFLQPVFMITSSASLLTLYFAGSPDAWPVFRVLWITNAVTYLFITGCAVLMDPQTGRHAWRQALLFPGLVNLVIIADSCFPRLVRDAADAGPRARAARGLDHRLRLRLAGRVAGHRLPGQGDRAALGKRLGVGRWSAGCCSTWSGYGTLLCACTFASYVKELRKAEMTWDKTEKTGKVTIPT